MLTINNDFFFSLCGTCSECSGNFLIPKFISCASESDTSRRIKKKNPLRSWCLTLDSTLNTTILQGGAMRHKFVSIRSSCASALLQFPPPSQLHFLLTVNLRHKTEHDLGICGLSSYLQLYIYTWHMSIKTWEMKIKQRSFKKKFIFVSHISLYNFYIKEINKQISLKQNAWFEFVNI